MGRASPSRRSTRRQSAAASASEPQRTLKFRAGGGSKWCLTPRGDALAAAHNEGVRHCAVAWASVPH